MVKALQIRLGETLRAQDADAVRSEKPIERGTTYVPELKKDFTQRDKDRFLEVAFNAIRDYFRRAAEDLQARYDEVDANFIEVDNEKFRCRLYLGGDLRNECLIRTGAFISRDSIGYTEGTRILSENSYNEIVTVVDDEPELYLRFSMGVFLTVIAPSILTLYRQQRRCGVDLSLRWSVDKEISPFKKGVCQLFSRRY